MRGRKKIRLTLQEDQSLHSRDDHQTSPRSPQPGAEGQQETRDLQVENATNDPNIEY